MNRIIKETICPLIGAGIFIVVFGAAVAHAAEDHDLSTSTSHATIGAETSSPPSLTY